MENLICFFSENWPIITGIAATVAYIIEKTITYLKENKQKKIAYNLIFTGLVKLYHSYLHHKSLYQEKPVIAFPDEMFIPIIKHLDTFNQDVENFKTLIDSELEIIPQISIKTYNMFNIIDRLRIVDRIMKSGEPDTEIPNEEFLIIKRAQFYAFSEFLDEFFEECIEEIRKKTSVSKKYTKKLFFLNTTEYENHSANLQKRIMKRYIESAQRQGLTLPENLQGLISD